MGQLYHVSSGAKLSVTGAVVDGHTLEDIGGAEVLASVFQDGRMVVRNRVIASSDQVGFFQYTGLLRWGKRMGPIEKFTRDPLDGVLVISVEHRGYQTESYSYVLTEVLMERDGEAFPIDLGVVELAPTTE